MENNKARSIHFIGSEESASSELTDLNHHHPTSAIALPKNHREARHISVETEPRFIEPYQVTETWYANARTLPSYPEVDVLSAFWRPVPFRKAVRMFETTILAVRADSGGGN
ncbi:hypothetical protein BV898_11830 [Hypsibius exemplaris]|uniref:Uncharacterized protein n=1 Tax=Hypsibius exemplaris TaxID=2072580 RepID=A0A1W0WFH5_HYPEX|nr:hypothetical protein BV898_11830 [Hypsibius exemplaris]